MPAAAHPLDEPDRLAALRDLCILDSAPNAEFDAIVRTASIVCGSAISLISLIDDNRQWFKANHGLPEVAETPRNLAFCGYTILQDDVFEVEDATKDDRLKDNALVVGEPRIRFYAGAPLLLADGSRIGSLCVIDREPRRLDDKQREALRCLARAAAQAIQSWRDRRQLRAASDSSRQLAAELAAQHELLRMTLHSIGDGVITTDGSGLIVSLNAVAERLTGWLACEARGRVACEVFRVIDEVTGDQAPDPIVACLTEGGSFSLLAHPSLLTREGGRVAIEGSISCIRNDCSDILGVIVVVHDVTERRRLEAARDESEREQRKLNAELERMGARLVAARDAAECANHAKSRFLMGMSHELRTPLNGILGYAQLLRMEGNLNAGQEARVAGMLKAGAHLLDLISSVLDLSKIEADQKEARTIPVILRDVAQTCIDLVRPAAINKELVLSLAIAPDVPRTLMTDPIRLQQIVLNLVANAVKFTARGSVILRVGVAQAPQAVRIEVVDTGPGIPAEQRNNLFREFGRLNTSAAEPTEGAGIGLALSARLAGLLGGTLGHTDNPAGGAIFWLDLPHGVAVPKGAEVTAVGFQSSPPVLTWRILVVDDVPMNRDVAAAFLRHAGHKVTCVDSGPAAIAALAAEEFDAVLMDVRMPDMDGLETTRRIRMMNDGRPDMPIVAMTAMAFSDQFQRCIEAGMNGHVAKPLQHDTLLAAIGDAVAPTSNVCGVKRAPIYDSAHVPDVRASSR